MTNRTYQFDCPFGDDEDCPNVLTVETDGRWYDDVTGCHHVIEVIGEKSARIQAMLETRYNDEYEDEMDRRVDRMRDGE
jgi:hypothetical protein